jgi:hypothetical protein
MEIKARKALAFCACLFLQCGGSLAQDTSGGGDVIGILFAAGDISFCDDDEAWHTRANKTAAIIKREIAAAAAAQPAIPVRVLALGDLAYEDGTMAELVCFKGRWGDFYDVLLPVPGNHEYRRTNYDGGPYFDHFNDKPFLTENGEKTGYYAQDFPRADGPWRLIGLNAYVGGQHPDWGAERRAAMKKQMEWLETKLDTSNESNRQNCVLAFWHPPIFSSGRHGHGYKTRYRAPLTTENLMQKAFRALYKHHASVVLAGHDHNYEQFKPHDAEGNAKEDGIRSFVIGTGGSLLTQTKYKFAAPNSEDVAGVESITNGVLKIELFENSYRWSFLSIDESRTPVLTTTQATCNARMPASP